LTASGKIKRASASITVAWISKTWKEMPVNIIPESFLKCCLSNEEDGTQVGILWDDSEQSGECASTSENENATEGSLDQIPY
jgi:riboflavin synthase alpha subunit